MSVINPILKENLDAKCTSGKELSALVRKYLRCKDVDKKSELRDVIFNNSIRMIRKLTIKVVGAQSSYLEDAFQGACVDFLHGLDKYKPRKKIEFTTYIYFWILKGIKDEFYNRNTIKVGRDAIKKDKYANFREGAIFRLNTTKDPCAPADFNETRYLIDKKTDTAKDIDDRDALDYLRNLGERYLSTFEFSILRLRYFYEETPTQLEIAKRIGMTRQNIHLAESNALLKMRKLLKDNCIDYKRTPGLSRKKVFVSDDGLDKIYNDIINSRPVKDIQTRRESYEARRLMGKKPSICRR